MDSDFGFPNYRENNDDKFSEAIFDKKYIMIFEEGYSIIGKEKNICITVFYNNLFLGQVCKKIGWGFNVLLWGKK